MKSIDLLRMFCRLCRSSSDCCAKEKECNDSKGNRWRSSRSPKAWLMDIRPVCARDEELERGDGEVREVVIGANDEVDRFGSVSTREG
jgi:hypothetical protein